MRKLTTIEKKLLEKGKTTFTQNEVQYILTHIEEDAQYNFLAKTADGITLLGTFDTRYELFNVLLDSKLVNDDTAISDAPKKPIARMQREHQEDALEIVHAMTQDDVIKFLAKNHNSVENMAKKQVSRRKGLSQTIEYTDIVNDVYVRALDGKIDVTEGNPFTTIFYTIQNITRKEVRRLKKQSTLWDMEEIEIQDSYESYNQNTDIRSGKNQFGNWTKIDKTEESYTRSETVVTGMHQYKERADVATMQKKAISSNFADGVVFALDMESMFDEIEYKVFNLLRMEWKIKDINAHMGQRCDRIIKRIESKIESYMKAE